MERDQGGWPRSGTVEMLAVGASAAMENARRSAIVEVRVRSSYGDFFWRMEIAGYSRGLMDERLRLLGHWAGVADHEQEHSDRMSSL